MSGPQDEIDALTKQVAALTARIYKLEKISGVPSDSQPEPVPWSQPQKSASAPSGTMVQPPSAQQPVTQSQPNLLSAFPRKDPGLEKQIGQFWLNRIGIVAVLFGVSYFLKYAFENNWIGPAGRVAIGLLAGIGLIVWSERFRNPGHHCAGFEPGCGIAGQFCFGGRIRYSDPAFYGTKPRGRAVFIRRLARRGDFGDGRRKALAPPTLGKFSGYDHSLCRLVRGLLFQRSADSDSLFFSIVCCHLCRDSAGISLRTVQKIYRTLRHADAASIAERCSIFPGTLSDV